MNKIIIITVIALVFIGSGIYLNNKFQKQSIKTNPSEEVTKDTLVKLITPKEFEELSKLDGAFIIDVHTPKQTHIPNTKAFIPYNQIAQNLDRLPKDKSVPILVYCRSGNMSALASKEIASLGYQNVYDLEGGTDAYKTQVSSVNIWPDKQELGTVIYGDVPTTQFTLTNYTSEPLNITRVSTSCSCTIAKVEKDTLEAFESTTINVSFNPAVHKDDTDLGELTRTIYIETDNADYHMIESVITANVIKQ